MQAEWHRGPSSSRGRRGLRVLVVDLDVHQGDGTASIFQDDPTVFTLSLHGERNFPARKQHSDLDVPLPDGCDDDTYLAALSAALQQAFERTREAPPQLAFFLAGADPHEGDRLGRLSITAQGLAARDRLVLDTLRARRLPVALSMAGGYGRDLPTTVAIQLHTLKLAHESWRDWATGHTAAAMPAE